MLVCRTAVKKRWNPDQGHHQVLGPPPSSFWEYNQLQKKVGHFWRALGGPQGGGSLVLYQLQKGTVLYNCCLLLCLFVFIYFRGFYVIFIIEKCGVRLIKTYFWDVPNYCLFDKRTQHIFFQHFCLHNITKKSKLLIIQLSIFGALKATTTLISVLLMLNLVLIH